MNLLRSLILIFVAGTMLCCKKDPSDGIKNDGLLGKWKLVEILSDPGDGSGKFVKVNEGQSGTLEFKANGDFKEIKGPIYSYININDRFVLIDGSRIELTSTTNPSAAKLIWHIQELTPQVLVLNLGCFEPCKAKFVAIR